MLESLAARPFPFLLDGGGWGRYSFLGADPFANLDGLVRDPFAAAQTILAAHPVVPEDGLPPFLGGGVGYWSYDLGRRLERLPALAMDDLLLPELRLCFYGECLAFEHGAGVVHLLATGYPERDQRLAERRALEGIARLEDYLRGGGRTSGAAPAAAAPNHTDPILSTFTRDGYCRAVQRVLDYIGDGDIFQANLSQRFSAHLPSAPLVFHRRLREGNPAPFGGYFAFPEGALVSASPERFLRVHGDGRVETVPIKGTRPRGATAADDAALRRQLVESRKDRAELIMIVDLERNDLGKVCATGTVRAPRLPELESHPTVHHLSATVTGKLRDGLTAVDALRATFPGGSITGAPKVRAMEIIEELEPVRRGPYTGAFGYLSFSGEADLNVAIRIALLRGDRAYFHAGGGVVADSDPAGEYEESMVKARAIAEALGYPWPVEPALDPVVLRRRRES